MTTQPEGIKLKERYYPECCTSAFCGGCGDDCLGCKFEATKEEFEQWVERYQAVQPDSIWCPTFYQATI